MRSSAECGMSDIVCSPEEVDSCNQGVDVQEHKLRAQEDSSHKP